MALKNTDYSVIYEDKDFVVLNKRSGILIAADRYDENAPRLDVLASEQFGKLFAVHRIDKDTSGLIVYARNAEAQRNLSMQFEKREVKKVYHALVHGHPLWKELTVDLPLLPDGDAKHRTVVNKKLGKKSITEFIVAANCGPYSWIIAKPLTGRTHQIRVHLADSGFSIVCDPLYGGNLQPVKLSNFKKKWNGDEFEERPLLKRLALHAYSIEFNHPSTGEKVSFTAPYPKDMDATRKQLEKVFGESPFDFVEK